MPGATHRNAPDALQADVAGAIGIHQIQRGRDIVRQRTTQATPIACITHLQHRFIRRIAIIEGSPAQCDRLRGDAQRIADNRTMTSCADGDLNRFGLRAQCRWKRCADIDPLDTDTEPLPMISYAVAPRVCGVHFLEI